jgi:threonine synthase
VPQAIGDFLILRAVRESKGFANRGDGRENFLLRAMKSRVFNCATGLKHPLPPIRRALNRFASIDYERMSPKL